MTRFSAVTWADNRPEIKTAGRRRKIYFFMVSGFKGDFMMANVIPEYNAGINKVSKLQDF